MSGRTPAGQDQPPRALLEAPYPPAVREVVRTLKGAGFHAYLVGGCVRDLVRGRAAAQAKDWDVATSALPTQVRDLFRRVVPTGIAHGTVIVLVKGLPVEVTTFRGEGAYADGRRPSEVRFLSDIREDLARRDFTINAMAYDPEEQLFVDPFGGRADLAARTVRCVGEARERFGEDGLRAMRAVRFASTLEFALDPATEAAIPGTLPTFRKVAVERIQQEFTRLLDGPAPSRGLDLMVRTGLLDAVLPEVAHAPVIPRAALLDHLLGTVDAVQPADTAVRLAALLHASGLVACGDGAASAPVAAAVLEHLRYPRKVIDDAATLVRELPGLEAMPDTDVAARRLLSRLGPRVADRAVSLAHAHARAAGRPTSASPERAARVAARVAAVRAAAPPLTPSDLALRGADVVAALGGERTARVGQAIRHLLDRVLEDPGLNTREALASILVEWAAAHPE